MTYAKLNSFLCKLRTDDHNKKAYVYLHLTEVFLAAWNIIFLKFDLLGCYYI